VGVLRVFQELKVGQLYHLFGASLVIIRVFIVDVVRSKQRRNKKRRHRKSRQRWNVRRRTQKSMFVLEEVIKHSPPSLEGHRMHDARLGTPVKGTHNAQESSPTQEVSRQCLPPS
jgi:hypothetical protein